MSRKNDNNTGDTVVYTDTGKISGKIRGDTFYRTVRNNHILRKPPALAMDASICVELQTRGVAWLEFKNADTGDVYRTAFNHFLTNSFEIDRGYGRQRALPLIGWARRAPGTPRQMSLFGGRQ